MPSSARHLPLLGAAPPSPSPRGPAIVAKGFRPFFLLAGVFATAMLPLWLLALAGSFDPGGYLGAVYWHAHEMVFGYAVAVLAGFLLTAVGNWTQRETAVGLPLAGLCALWALGRVAMLTASWLPRGLAAALDLAFLPALAVTLARPILATKNRRNFVMVAVLVALWALDLSVHFDALGVLPGWRRRGSLLGIDLVALVMLIIAGRVFPMFTRNATRVETIRTVPALEVATVGSMLAFVALDIVWPDATVTALAAIVTALVAAARTLHWGARHTRANPMLWILHLGYAWIPLGLALRGIAHFTALIPAPVATHALTVGALGALTLGMMTRVSLGHSGRPIEASRTTTWSFALITLAALVRVFVPLVHAPWYRPSLFLAGSLWSLAFALFTLGYAPVLTTPRADGKPG
jgi:uncharacterized protein involved in response to NO